MSKQMQDDLFDYILAHALGDVCEDEVRRANEIAAEVTFSEKFNQFFKRLIAKRKRERFVRATPRYTKRILLSFCAMFSAISLALFTQGPVQAAVKSVFYEWTQEYVSYELNPTSQPQSHESLFGIRFNYVPVGYLFHEARISPFSLSTVAYIDGISTEMETPTIYLYCSNISNQITVCVDNEHGIREPFDIPNSTDVLFIKSNDDAFPSQLFWNTDGYFYQMSTPASILNDEIQKIAMNIELIK